MPESDIAIRIVRIDFSQGENGRDASVKFDIVEGEELDEVLSIEEYIPCPSNSDDFVQIVQDAAKSLHSRLLKATDSLAKRYGL